MCENTYNDNYNALVMKKTHVDVSGDLHLMESQEQASAKSGHSFALGFGVGATTLAAAWAASQMTCFKQGKYSVHEPLL